MNSPNPQQDYDYIDNNASLARFCSALGQAAYCAIDTEFIRESTYYPELALIQIASKDLLGCVDPLTITDFAPLAACV
jgi:ribonuclease D